MPIIFEDEVKKRRRAKLLVILAVAASMLIGVAIGWSWATFTDGGEPQILAPARAELTQGEVAEDGSTSASTLVAPALLDGSTCRVTDGDTIRCGEERIRLIGIDAPELPGHCRPGRDCVEGDPFLASSALQSILENERLNIRRNGEDQYGRTLAHVYVDQENVACLLYSRGYVAYVVDWDETGQLRSECPAIE